MELPTLPVFSCCSLSYEFFLLCTGGDGEIKTHKTSTLQPAVLKQPGNHWFSNSLATSGSQTAWQPVVFKQPANQWFSNSLETTGSQTT
jgi:hypothetical protein